MVRLYRYLCGNILGFGDLRGLDELERFSPGGLVVQMDSKEFLMVSTGVENVLCIMISFWKEAR